MSRDDEVGLARLQGVAEHAALHPSDVGAEARVAAADVQTRGASARRAAR